MHDSLPVNLNARFELPLDPLLCNTTLGRYAREYLIDRLMGGKRPKTMDIYGLVINDFLRYLSDHVPTPSEMRLYFFTLKKRGFKQSSIHVYYRSLRTWFRWAMREGLIKERRNPLRNVQVDCGDLTVVMPFTQDEIRRILAVVPGQAFFDYRMRATVLVLLDTALRLFEIAGMRLSDVDLLSGIVKIRGKGRRERLVRLGMQSRHALHSYLMRRTDNHECVWVTEERTPITPDGISVALYRLGRLAGITNKRHGPHVYRHTAAALFYLNCGRDIYAVQKFLGHTRVSTTENYLRSLGFEILEYQHETASPVDNLFRDNGLDRGHNPRAR